MRAHGVWRDVGARRHRAARVRRARLAIMVKATNDCAAASSGIETIEEKITSMLRRQRAFERQLVVNNELVCSAARTAKLGC